jgi:hypothetical protein
LRAARIDEGAQVERLRELEPWVRVCQWPSGVFSYQINKFKYKSILYAYVPVLGFLGAHEFKVELVPPHVHHQHSRKLRLAGKQKK